MCPWRSSLRPLPSQVQLSVAAGTDIGRVRAGNEDSLHADADQRHGLFVVADGMGGHAAGEVASAMAVETVAQLMADVADVAAPGVMARLGSAIVAANATIYDRTRREPEKRGMGTTVSALLLGSGRYVIAHVGDSRVYLLRGGTLRQLTTDHSWVQEQVAAGLLSPAEARGHPYSNVITRCVGANAAVHPDVLEGALADGDLILVASDGLTGMVDDPLLQRILEGGTQPGRMVDLLITEANRRGGQDNITAIVVQVVRVSTPTPSWEYPALTYG